MLIYGRRGGTKATKLQYTPVLLCLFWRYSMLPFLLPSITYCVSFPWLWCQKFFITWLN